MTTLDKTDRVATELLEMALALSKHDLPVSYTHLTLPTIYSV